MPMISPLRCRKRLRNVVTLLAILPTLTGCEAMLDFLRDLGVLRGQVEGACIYYTPVQAFYEDPSFKPRKADAKIFSQEAVGTAIDRVRRSLPPTNQSIEEVFKLRPLWAPRPPSCQLALETANSYAGQVMEQSVEYRICMQDWSQQQHLSDNDECPRNYSALSVGAQVDLYEGDPVVVTVHLLDLASKAGPQIPIELTKVQLNGSEPLQRGDWRTLGQRAGEEIAIYLRDNYRKWQAR